MITIRALQAQEQQNGDVSSRPGKGAAAPPLRAQDRATLNNAALPGRAAVSVPAVSQPQDVYTWLLRVLLATPDGQTQRGAAGGDQVEASVLSYVLLLIGRKWERMDAAAVLGCLPDSVTLREMSSSVAAMSVGMMRRSHGCKLQARPLVFPPLQPNPAPCDTAGSSAHATSVCRAAC